MKEKGFSLLPGVRWGVLGRRIHYRAAVSSPQEQQGAQRGGPTAS